MEYSIGLTMVAKDLCSCLLDVFITIHKALHGVQLQDLGQLFEGLQEKGGGSLDLILQPLVFGCLFLV